MEEERNDWKEICDLTRNGEYLLGEYDPSEHSTLLLPVLRRIREVTLRHWNVVTEEWDGTEDYDLCDCGPPR